MEMRYFRTSKHLCTFPNKNLLQNFKSYSPNRTFKSSLKEIEGITVAPLHLKATIFIFGGTHPGAQSLKPQFKLS